MWGEAHLVAQPAGLLDWKWASAGGAGSSWGACHVLIGLKMINWQQEGSGDRWREETTVDLVIKSLLIHAA